MATDIIQVRNAFQPPPSLYGAYVSVRPLNQADEEALYLIAADPLVWEQHPDKERHTREGFRRFFDKALESNGALLVIDALSKAVIGSSRYYGYNEKRSEVEIGWTFLSRSHWGGRYNGELKQLMLSYAFQSVKTVIFYIDPENKRSQRSVEKIGCVRDPILDRKGRVLFRIDASRFSNGI